MQIINYIYILIIYKFIICVYYLSFVDIVPIDEASYMILRVKTFCPKIFFSEHYLFLSNIICEK